MILTGGVKALVEVLKSMCGRQWLERGIYIVSIEFKVITYLNIFEWYCHLWLHFLTFKIFFVQQSLSKYETTFHLLYRTEMWFQKYVVPLYQKWDPVFGIFYTVMYPNSHLVLAAYIYPAEMMLEETLPSD